jgi:polyisoprenoid-binding protein YceI
VIFIGELGANMQNPIQVIASRMKLLGMAAALAALVAARALATPSAPTGTYQIDPDHTQVVFEIKHMGISTFYGRLGKATGMLNFDQAAPERGSLNVQIDMHTIDTHVPSLDSKLVSSVFQADKFPIATFVATKIEKTGDNAGSVAGDLTLAGVTKPVTLSVVFNGGRGSAEPLQPYRIGFDATATVKRSDFGLTHMIWSGFVSDEVQLLIEAEAVRK